MSGVYGYASGDLLAAPNTYFYSRFEGDDFLRGWRDSREACRRAFVTRANTSRDRGPLGELPPPTADEGPALAFLREQLRAFAENRIDATCRRDLEQLLRNFEAKKRLYRAYEPDFRSRGRSDHDDLRVYVCFGLVLIEAARYWPGPRWVNALLKLLDIVCACGDRVDPAWRTLVPSLIDAEYLLVGSLARRLGVAW